MKKREFKELRTLSAAELGKKAAETRKKMWETRVKIFGSEEKNTKIVKKLKTELAQILTLISEKKGEKE